jgi:[ribosomal protein S18]-alanine N-acetyltransferase
VTVAGATAAPRIEPATLGDAASLAAIDAATSTQPWSEAGFVQELGRDDRHYVVARSRLDGEVIGYAGVAVLAGDAHVMGLAVRPAAQGRGVGARLLDAVLAVIARTGVSAVTLEVRPSNEPALHLYRRAGFVSAGRRPGYYPDGEDAIIMWRTQRSVVPASPEQREVG